MEKVNEKVVEGTNKESFLNKIFSVVLGFIAPGAGHIYRGKIQLGFYICGTMFLIYISWYFISGFSAYLYLSILFLYIIVASVTFLHLIKITVFNKGKGLERVYLTPAIVVLLLFVSSHYLMKKFATYHAYQIPSSSMSPNIITGDLLLAKKFTFGVPKLHRGGIIIFKNPSKKDDFPFIKRIIGLPGDKIEYFLGDLMINGVRIHSYDTDLAEGEFDKLMPFFNLNGIPDDYKVRYEKNGDVKYQILYSSTDSREQKEYLVPEGHVYVLGDHRLNSRDSRDWGAIPIESIIGKPLNVIFNNKLFGERFGPIK